MLEQLESSYRSPTLISEATVMIQFIKTSPSHDTFSASRTQGKARKFPSQLEAGGLNSIPPKLREMCDLCRVKSGQGVSNIST
jgi:hypothetical protein